jgi:hypothetical protein
MTAYELEKQTGDIFGNTYWGYAKVSAKLSPEKMATIYRNRLDFYNEQQLYRRWKDRCVDFVKRYAENGFEQDHVEAYTAQYGSAVVLICSNYNCPPHPFLMMREVAPLYVPFSTTYAVRFLSKEAARAVLKAFPYVFEMTKTKEAP